jgi:hypothetical protein
MTTSARVAKSQATHPLSPAERTAKLLAYRRGSHNYTSERTPSKVVPVASRAFATA